MKSLLAVLPLLLPMVYTWIEQQEETFLAEGRPLTEPEMADARRAGVAAPEKVRIVVTEKLPHPINDEIMFAARQVGLFTERSVSLSTGHGICLTETVRNDRCQLVHELVHVGQYERLGTRPFLKQFLRESIDPGYPFGALEQEARRVSKAICGEPAPDPGTAG
jgi:hypothetical protein